MHLSISSVSKTYEPLTILRDISFTVSDNERVGLVGANGSGKSTLLRILAGEIEADGGAVVMPTGVRLGYLPQDPPEPDSAALGDLILSAAGDIRRLESSLRELEERMATADPGEFDAVMEEYGDLLERFERSGGYDIEHRIDRVLEGLRIAHIPRSRLFASLSGGEKSRVLLATLLLTSPDVLLLDEPTNHLDFASIHWLEEYLGQHRGILIVVSHDRRFLNQTVSRIVEIDEHTHQIRDYPGDYDHYAEVRQRERLSWEETFAAEQEELSELRRAIRQARAGVDRKAPPPRDGDKNILEAHRARADKTSSKNIRSLEERLRRIEENPTPRPPAMMRMQPRLDSDDLQSDEIVRFDGVSVAFDSRAVLRDVSFTLRRGDRVVLIGENGAGKSTLLNLIAGRLTPDAGTIHVAAGARIGYLDQSVSSFDPSQRVLDAYRDGLEGLEHELVSDLIRHGLFAFDDMTKRVGDLSSGQRRKLQIARLVATRANFLLLDEPTNHLSLDVLEEFERALAEFSGPVLAASHDRYFIERSGARVWEVADCGVREIHVDVRELLGSMASTGVEVEA